MFFSCVGSILVVGGLSTHSPCLPSSTWVVEPNHLPEPVSEQFLDSQLYQISKSITVKVLLEKSWGSGILVHKQGDVYTVLTNAHVLAQAYGHAYRIQTPDGQIYSANLVGTVNLKSNYDLGLISFRSSKEYALASIVPSSTPAVGDRVFAAGFPFNPDLSQPEGFTLTNGQISLLSDKAFAGGYQIGYNNRIEKGMSGGPLLNVQGQVIGINGIHAYPLWGNPYVFTDGSVPSKTRQEQMSQLSWGIPIQTFFQIKPQFLSTSPSTFSNLQEFASQESKIDPTVKPLIRDNPKPTFQAKPRLW